LSTVPIQPVIEQSLSAVEIHMAQRKVTVNVSVPEALAVRADPKALDHILVNLIDNGVKYGRPDGNVWVEARPTDASVRIEVRDDGPGIADKHRTRVFERFYRADPSRSREAGGTGLGLSIVKHVAASHGGEVRVWSVEGQGSTFTLSLPRRVGEPPAAAGDTDAHRTTGPADGAGRPEAPPAGDRRQTTQEATP